MHVCAYAVCMRPFFIFVLHFTTEKEKIGMQKRGVFCRSLAERLGRLSFFVRPLRAKLDMNSFGKVGVQSHGEKLTCQD